jgi:hypothetical protein
MTWKYITPSHTLYSLSIERDAKIHEAIKKEILLGVRLGMSGLNFLQLNLLHCKRRAFKTHSGWG